MTRERHCAGDERASRKTAAASFCGPPTQQNDEGWPWIDFVLYKQREEGENDK